MPVDSFAHRTWEAALGRLQLQVTRPSFDTWLRGTEGVAVDDGTLVVDVPTPFAAEWLERRMHGLIEEAVNAIAPQPLHISYRVRHSNRPEGPAAPPKEEAASETSRPSEPTVKPAATLIARYSFDNFIVGTCNQLAYAAGMAVADAPGKSYNPLFIHGAVGIGKTHLLHAIGLRASSAGHSVSYVSAEQFTNEFLGAIRDRRTEEFRNRYRAADILLIDDIQFIAGKEGTQEGFFHTFNALHGSGRQIVLTSDRPPSALPLLEERLRSRFEWGLMADISAPSVETRTAILQHLAQQSPVAVPDEVIEYLAQRTASSIRTIEGSLNRVTAMAHFTNTPVSMELAKQSLGVETAEEAGDSSPKSVVAAVAVHYGLTPGALVSGRRQRDIAHARQIAMYLLNQHLHLSPEEIGPILGGRDRTTVIYGIKKTIKRIATDSAFAAEIERIKPAQAQHSS